MGDEKPRMWFLFSGKANAGVSVHQFLLPLKKQADPKSDERETDLGHKKFKDPF